MKRLTIALLYGLIAALGLIWAVGCSTSSSGPSATPNYQLSLALTRPTYNYNNDPSDTVICWVQDSQSAEVIFGARLKFSTKSDSGQTAPSSTFSDTLGTGTYPVVHYTNDSPTDSIDWIYAALLTNDGQDTVLVDSISILILH
jgi:ligand-binding SRPBCC domain-containing protein